MKKINLSLDEFNSSLLDELAIESQHKKVINVMLAESNEGLLNDHIKSLNMPSPEFGSLESRKSLSEIVKEQLYIFLCTDEDVYKESRKRLDDSIKQIIPIIATAIAASIGIAVGIVTGFVTAILLAALKIYKNSYCIYLSPDNE